MSRLGKEQFIPSTMTEAPGSPRQCSRAFGDRRASPITGQGRAHAEAVFCADQEQVHTIETTLDLKATTRRHRRVRRCQWRHTLFMPTTATLRLQFGNAQRYAMSRPYSQGEGGTEVQLIKTGFSKAPESCM